MKLYSALLLIVILSNSVMAERQDKIRFFCGINSNSNFYQAYSKLYAQAFSNMGYEFEMLPRPLTRVMADLIRGTADGDCGRVDRLSELTGRDSFVRVEALIAMVSTGIWIYNPSIKRITEQDLSSNSYRIGILRGDLALQAKLRSLNVKFNSIDDAVMGLKMLYGGRFDLFITSNVRVDSILQVHPDLIRPDNVGNLMDLEIYPYLNEKHKRLAIPLAHELNTLLADPQHPVHKYSGLTPQQ